LETQGALIVENFENFSSMDVIRMKIIQPLAENFSGAGKIPK
jgi:hypothetical protein